jgi:hypothetical protein
MQHAYHIGLGCFLQKLVDYFLFQHSFAEAIINQN